MSEANLSTAPARGMRDMLPQETALRDWAITRLVSIYQQFGFTRIETPAVENIANLKKAEGGENLSLIFEILKRGDKLEKALSENGNDQQKLIRELSDLGLRFDLTVPLVRFYAHNQAQLSYPFKTIQIGSVWRAESPQAGRYRQFTQCDIDTFGVKSEIAEMELIQATAEALLALGFDNFEVHINDRRILTAMASCYDFAERDHDNLFIQIDKLDKIGPDGVKKELLSHGYRPDQVDQVINFITRMPRELSQERWDLLPPNVEEMTVSRLKNVYNATKKIANGRYSVIFSPSLVRGMGYYTGQIFEIKAPGYGHSIAGGGRYDKMVGKYTGRDVPACGLSIGFERIMSILMEKGVKAPAHSDKIALLYDQDRDELDKVFIAADVLRKEGKHVSLLPKKKEMRKQIDNLIQENYSGYAVYYPEKEKPEIKTLG